MACWKKPIAAVSFCGSSPGPQRVASLQVEVVGLDVVRRMRRRARRGVVAARDAERRDDAVVDGVLEREQLGARARELLAPDLTARGHVVQVDDETETIAGGLHRPLDDQVRAEAARRVLDRCRVSRLLDVAVRDDRTSGTWNSRDDSASTTPSPT
jgi:hypothetical protein